MKSSVRVCAPAREKRAEAGFFTRRIRFRPRGAIRPKIFLTGKFSEGAAISEGKSGARKFLRARGGNFFVRACVRRSNPLHGRFGTLSRANRLEFHDPLGGSRDDQGGVFKPKAHPLPVILNEVKNPCFRSENVLRCHGSFATLRMADPAWKSRPTAEAGRAKEKGAPRERGALKAGSGAAIRTAGEHPRRCASGHRCCSAGTRRRRAATRCRRSRG